jgi:hypothetical protein
VRCNDSYLPLPPGLNVPDVRRPDDGANAVCIVQERPGGVHLSQKKEWMTYHAAVDAAAAAALGSCWPIHPDSGIFAVSGLGSPKVLQLLARNSSGPKYRESDRSRRMAVAREDERFEEIYAATAVAVAVIGSTKAQAKAVPLPLLLGW